MKIALGSKIVDGAWGGGNNFIKNLSHFLKKNNCEVFFDLNNKDLDLILLTDPRAQSSTSTFDHFDIFNYLNNKPDTIVAHRINECDERKNTKNVNKQILEGNYFCDYTIFISTWLKELFTKIKNIENYKVILNGANQEIFNFDSKIYDGKTPFKIVTHHWSNHINKGFEIYQKIDDRLDNHDFKKEVSFTIIGNTPKSLNFKNTKIIEPLFGKDLSNELNKNHAYITASKNEPGGNHQNEAINCGLPVLYLNSGCMEEYCEGYGVEYSENNLFKKINHLKEIQIKFRENCRNYQYHSINTCDQYFKLFCELIKNKEKIVRDREKKQINIYKKIKYKINRILN